MLSEGQVINKRSLCGAMANSMAISIQVVNEANHNGNVKHCKPAIVVVCVTKYGYNYSS